VLEAHLTLDLRRAQHALVARWIAAHVAELYGRQSLCVALHMEWGNFVRVLQAVIAQ
jgi:hypothetical protein